MATKNKAVILSKLLRNNIANPPAAIDQVNLVANTSTTITSVQGGLWNSPATWSGGVVPPAQSDVTISAGHIVTQNQNIIVKCIFRVVQYVIRYQRKERYH